MNSIKELPLFTQMRIKLIVVLVLGSIQGYSQAPKPAGWQVEWDQASISVGNQATLHFKVSLQEGWYIYAPDQDPDLGPVPTSVVFEKNEAFTPVGIPKSVKVKEKYDDVWEGTVRIIEESGGGFTQILQVLKANPVIRGRIIYTVCSEKTGQCLFPEEDFEITLTRKND